MACRRGNKSARRLSKSGNAAVANKPELRTSAKRFERCRIGPRHPRLRPQTDDFRKQRSPPINVEMRRHFIQQQDRREPALAFGNKLRMRQYDAEQQRLLFTR